MKKIVALFVVLTLFSGCIGNDYSSVEIVENSPYPEFIYVNNDMLKIIVNNISEKQISDHFFVILDGAYINKNNYSKLAVRTPLWRFGGLFVNENTKSGNGLIFLNSNFVGTPDLKYNIPLNYNDIIIYDENYGIFIEIGKEYSSAEIIAENFPENKYFMEYTNDIASKNIINRTIIEKEDILIGIYVLEGGIPITNLNNGVFNMHIKSKS
ncbi:hypothetical protein [Methanococcus maripaludis]|uniref:Uncharacterized protein n=2 Tax=Methanococcus maripaludis TaxID=39152 RepID=A0A7J9PEI0_METMI|nr:hypothetical protein [Methanococcus maripaludis]MBA2861194.1 hypothetical protein [Methanococcus maripaludis]